MQFTHCSNTVNFPSPHEAESYYRIPPIQHKLTTMDCEICGPFFCCGPAVAGMVYRGNQRALCPAAGHMILPKVLGLTKRTGQIPFFLPWHRNSAPLQHLNIPVFSFTTPDSQ